MVADALVSFLTRRHGFWQECGPGTRHVFDVRRGPQIQQVRVVQFVPDLDWCGSSESSPHEFGMDSDLSRWQTDNLEDMAYMFDKAVSFSSDLPWDVSKITDLEACFQEAYSFNG